MQKELRFRSALFILGRNFPEAHKTELITASVLKAYEKLPKQGKPDKNEWTHLAGVVQENTEKETFECVALGTGSKSLPHSTAESLQGFYIHDSHAEILARRSFVKYLLHQMKASLSNAPTPSSSSIFSCSTLHSGMNQFRLEKKIKFHFFISHVPCGDAAILQSSADIEKSPVHEESDELISPKRQRFENTAESENVEEELLRTGAKCVRGEIADAENHSVCQQLGVLRRKPGRGVASYSMSCSDKLMRWNVCGWQGALVCAAGLDNPVHMHSIVIAKCVRSLESLERALHNRLDGISLKENDSTTKHYYVNTPLILFSPTAFVNGKYFKQNNNGTCKKNLKPAPAAIAWSQGCKADVIINGCRQGATKSKLLTSGSVSINKRNLWKAQREVAGGDCNNDETYYDVKMKALDYQKVTEKFMTHFPLWIRTDSNAYKFKYN